MLILLFFNFQVETVIDKSRGDITPTTEDQPARSPSKVTFTEDDDENNDINTDINTNNDSVRATSKKKVVEVEKKNVENCLDFFNDALCSRYFQNVKLRLDFVEI